MVIAGKMDPHCMSHPICNFEFRLAGAGLVLSPGSYTALICNLLTIVLIDIHMKCSTIITKLTFL